MVAFPQTNQEFIVEVDASNAVGGVLSQKQIDDSIHPIAYFSTSLHNAQHNWSPYSQETYALIVAIRHWEIYLTGNRFTVYSDHNTFVYLHKKKNPEGL